MSPLVVESSGDAIASPNSYTLTVSVSESLEVIHRFRDNYCIYFAGWFQNTTFLPFQTCSTWLSQIWQHSFLPCLQVITLEMWSMKSKFYFGNDNSLSQWRFSLSAGNFLTSSFSELYLLWVQYPWIFGEVRRTKLSVSICDSIS